MAVLGLALASGCATARPDLDLVQLADELATRDVVFLGEEHDNHVGHVQHARLLRLLHERRPQLSLSLEMFERDVQPVLDRYLAGEIDETEFLASSRPWPSYRDHYRPLIEYCKTHGLPVVASNVPRDLARRVAGGGLAAVAGEAHAAQQVSAPRDAYWQAFQAAMAGHQGASEKTMFAFYESQCLKDDTMAESIVRHLDARAATSPLVVHVCGKFHSDDRLGTVARVASRRPELRLGVVGMRSVDVVSRDGDDFVLDVPREPSFEKPPKTAPDGDAARATDVARTAGAAAAADTGEAGTTAAPGDADPSGRPALGFMPGYDDGVAGALVESLRPDGPAERAGIRAGDVIVRLGEREIGSLGDYLTELANLEVGKVVRVEVERAGERHAFDVTVGSRVQ